MKNAEERKKNQFLDDLEDGVEALQQYVRGERELRVTTLHREPASSQALKNGQSLPYVIIFEQGPQGWSATVPDLPGCVSSGPTMEEAEIKVVREMRRFVKAAHSSGKPVPAPNVRVKTLVIPI